MHAAGAGLEGQAFTQRPRRRGRPDRAGGLRRRRRQALPGRDACTAAASSSSTPTGNTRTCVWPGRRKTAPRPSAAIWTISASPASPSMRPSSACTRTARPAATPTHFTLERRQAGRGHAGLRLGQPRRDPAAADPGPAVHDPRRGPADGPADRLGAARPADPLSRRRASDNAFIAMDPIVGSGEHLQARSAAGCGR